MRGERSGRGLQSVSGTIGVNVCVRACALLILRSRCLSCFAFVSVCLCASIYTSLPHPAVPLLPRPPSRLPYVSPFLSCIYSPSVSPAPRRPRLMCTTALSCLRQLSLSLSLYSSALRLLPSLSPSLPLDSILVFDAGVLVGLSRGCRWRGSWSCWLVVLWPLPVRE